MSISLCVPTYKRKLPMILEMLDKDSELEINFFVRGEDYDSGYYDELKTIERVKVHSLGYGLHELGLTRHRIMQYCLTHEIDYCAMFDDGITDLIDESSELSISKILDKVQSIMESDPLSEKVIGFSFHKHCGINVDGSKVIWPSDKLDPVNYFLTFPAQAVVLDVKKAFEYNIIYQSLDKVGFEDCAFFIDAVKAGLIYCSRKSIYINGIVPNAKKLGGSHLETEDLQRKYEIQTERLMKYAGHMMGLSVEQRYRSFAKCCMAYPIFNTSFFREVLCDKPELNQEIIKRKFMRYGYVH